MAKIKKIDRKMAKSILELKAIGVPIAEIARKKRISRQAIYDFLAHSDRYLTNV